MHIYCCNCGDLYLWWFVKWNIIVFFYMLGLVLFSWILMTCKVFLLFSGINSARYSSSSSFSLDNLCSFRFNSSSYRSSKDLSLNSSSFSDGIDSSDSGFSSLNFSSINRSSSSSSIFSSPEISFSLSSSISILCKYLVCFYSYFRSSSFYHFRFLFFFVIKVIVIFGVLIWNLYKLLWVI